MTQATVMNKFGLLFDLLPLTFGKLLANNWSSSLCASVPLTMNLPKGERSITPTFSITSLHSLPTGPNQFVLLKLGLCRAKNPSDTYLYVILYIRNNHSN